MRSLIVAGLMVVLSATAGAASAENGCGEIREVVTHKGSTTRYAVSGSDPGAAVLILLVGGGGHLDLDGQGCPQSLNRNVLVRMVPAFAQAGFATALVDAPSDFSSGDGLAGFRNAPEHADDLGKVIADLRQRGAGAVWVIGHSRGSISAANAGARLTPPTGPDGVVLMSAMMSGDSSAKKAFVAQTVFDLPLEAVKVPLLIVGHAADNCPRSPATLMASMAARVPGSRAQAVIVAGATIGPAHASPLAACDVGHPHDYVGQDAEVAAGIARFIRDGRY